MSEQVLLEMRRITKRFPGVNALQDVSFNVAPSEVHVLVGENGAGKSTLMKVLSGVYRQDEGSILLNGRNIDGFSIRSIQELGIRTIYQELNLCTNLTVAQNISLGRERTTKRLSLLDEKAAAERAQKYLSVLDCNISPRAVVSTLSIAEQQLVEISRALSFESRIIVMDEPTSSLTLKETEKLLETIRKLRDSGTSIIYISHRLEEVFQIADRVTVLRDGCHVATRPLEELNHDAVVQMMVGREIASKYINAHAEEHGIAEEVLLEVRNFTKKGLFENIAFQLKRGEILGFSGLVGAGRTELMESIYGTRKKDDGTLLLHGENISFSKPADAIKHGIAMVTEDRKRFGLFGNLNMRKNLTITKLRTLFRRCIISTSTEKEHTEKYITKLSIKPSNTEQPILTMSGGNQQKVLLSRAISVDPDILLLDEPTRGVDVGARGEIYDIIGNLSKEGKGIICVSSDLTEILMLCDRIVVMNRGAIKGEFMNSEATQEKIMALSI